MKKLFCIAVLSIGISPVALAQVYFGAGSARPINPGAASRDLQADNRPRANARRILVECRDGSRHIARVCRRHGGVPR
jgi:hypothetical protein